MTFGTYLVDVVFPLCDVSIRRDDGAVLFTTFKTCRPPYAHVRRNSVKHYCRKGKEMQ